MPRPEADVAAELRQFRYVPRQNKISELSRTLFEGETIISALYVPEKRGLLRALLIVSYEGSSTLVAVSEQRVLLLQTDRDFGERVSCKYNLWEEISTVEDHSNVVQLYIRIIDTSLINFWFPKGSVDEKKFREIYEYIEQRVQSNCKAAQSSDSTGSSASPGAFIAELERLGALRDQGVLTDEEFSATKRKLLGLRSGSAHL